MVALYMIANGIHAIMFDSLYERIAHSNSVFCDIHIVKGPFVEAEERVLRKGKVVGPRCGVHTLAFFLPYRLGCLVTHQ